MADDCAFDWYHESEIPIIAAFDAIASPFFTSRLIRSQKFMTESHQCVIIGIAVSSSSGKSLIASTLYLELLEDVGD